MKQRIVVGPLDDPVVVFDNATLEKVETVVQNSYSMEELAYDELIAVVLTDRQAPNTLVSSEGDTLVSSEGFVLVSSNGTLGTIAPETPIFYFADDHLRGKFYANRVTRMNDIVYEVAAISAIGLLTSRPHVGGVYTGQTFAEVVAGIVGGAFRYTVTPSVSLIQIYGWLPYSEEARENLHALLYAYGVMAYKDESGDVYFDFANSDLVGDIPADRTYVGGEIAHNKHYDLVRIAEHGFTALETDIEYTLFDNVGQTVADHLLVVFSNAPAHSLVSTGTLVIHESGVNYAVVSGNGTIRGKQYTHTQQLYEVGTPGGSVLELLNQTLVNTLNSANVADRMLAYFGDVEITETAVQVKREQSGERVTFVMPDKQPADGYIKKMTTIGLATIKAHCEIITGYTPTQGGNRYSNCDIIDTDGTWTVPEGVTEILAVLIGGGSGGEGATDGENGKTASFDIAGEGGEGGLAGVGGLPGKVFAQRITVNPGDSFAATIGTGGAPGARAVHGADKNPGADGTATTFAGFTSDAGERPVYGFVDIITGVGYATRGQDGVNGGRGGQGSDANFLVVDGEGITYRGVIYRGGRSNATLPDGARVAWTDDGRGHWYCFGGGSGAVAGHNGTDGSDGYFSNSSIYGGQGANAPAPVSPQPAANFGSGGFGGNGGGGGGGAGGADNDGATTEWRTYRNRYGAGSQGTPGTAGFDGAVFIYY